MENSSQTDHHLTIRNNYSEIIDQFQSVDDVLTNWLELYFHVEVTTMESSQKVQKRDIHLFIDFMIEDEGTDLRVRWTPRLSKKFQEHLKTFQNENSRRRWNDLSINRIIAHLKTFAKWIQKLKPFELETPWPRLSY